MNNPPSEIEQLQHLVSNLRRDLQNALMQSRRRGEVIEKCKVALVKCQKTFVTLENLKGYSTEVPPNIALQSVIQTSQALTAIEALEKEGL